MKLTTREDALINGIKRFFDGKPCKHGHILEKYTSDKSCCQCRLEKIREKRKCKEFRKEEIKREMSARDNSKEYKAKRNKNSRNWYKKKSKDIDFKLLQKQKNKEWRSSVKGIQWTSNYLKNKRLSDPIYLIADRCRGRLKDAFRNNGYKKNEKSSDMIGCTFDFLKTHIEKQFVKGMSWDNKYLWHIDHIVPLSSAKNEKEIISLFHFTNLRPLWAKDNLIKNDTVTHLI